MRYSLHTYNFLVDALFAYETKSIFQGYENTLKRMFYSQLKHQKKYSRKGETT